MSQNAPHIDWVYRATSTATMIRAARGIPASRSSTGAVVTSIIFHAQQTIEYPTSRVEGHQGCGAPLDTVEEMRHLTVETVLERRCRCEIEPAFGIGDEDPGTDIGA